MVAGLSIGALSKQTAVPISTLRVFERAGLLDAPERLSGKRRYAPEAVDRVLMIRLWQRGGFTHDEIGRLLADRHRRAEWQTMVRAKLAALDAQVSAILQARSQLEHALKCRAPDWTTCSWMRGAAAATGPHPR
jgi:DNA-binding transcriptional MerR regulator